MRLYHTYLLPLCIQMILGCAELQTDLTQPENSTPLHTEGILDPTDPDFHGKLIRANSWSMKDCTQCHGSSYSGGLTGSSCLSCHQESAGPENCATCHGSTTSPAPPKDIDDNNSITEKGVGSHQAHLQPGSLGRQLSCAECHQVPSGLYDSGHTDSELPAEIRLDGYLANLLTNEPNAAFYNSNLPTFIPETGYDYFTLGCQNTYCHGNFKNGNPNNEPVWTEPNMVICGTCHGDTQKNTLEERALPKTSQEGGSHPNITNCYVCHGEVVNQNLQIINSTKHIDGKLNLFGKDYRY